MGGWNGYLFHVSILLHNEQGWFPGNAVWGVLLPQLAYVHSSPETPSDTTCCGFGMCISPYSHRKLGNHPMECQFDF